VAHPIVCTSISRQRLPEARALARAVAAHHSGERLAVLVVDDPGDGATSPLVVPSAASRVVRVTESGEGEEPFERLCPADLGIEIRAVHELALCRSGDDLAACFVPALMQLLLRRGRPVVALDAEHVLLGPLVELAEPLASAGLVLMPRLLEPVPHDRLGPAEDDVVASGAYDPGFVAVAPGREPFLRWWSAALRRAASSSADRLATAQPFLDLVPDGAGAHVLRHPGYGVAYWNAHERSLEWSEGGGYRAAGAPLRLVHLQGFDRAVPQLLSAAAGTRPRVLLSEHPALRRLCDERVADLERARDTGRDRWPTGVHLADGTLLEQRMRHLVRRALSRVDEPRGKPLVPDPFEPSEVEAFHDWLASPDPADTVAPTMPRYVREIYGERPDLQWHFRRVGTVDMAHFREWVASHGLDESGAPVPVRAAIARTPWWAAPRGVVVAPPGTLRTGVVLAGYLRAESGVGEAARLVYSAMRSALVDVAPVVLGSTPSRQRHPFEPGFVPPAIPVADRNVNLLWTNADQLPGFASIVGPDFFAGRYNIGFWAWETERLPQQLAASAALLDEIWVPSAYVRDAVQPVVDRSVFVFPHPIVSPPIDPAFNPVALGVPEGYRFLFTYDFLSSFARKNPLGVLEAFAAAFRPGEGPVLVLKSVNGDRRPAERERLLLAAAGRPDVVVVDRYLSAAERGALIVASDCFVSLHRAEGFGLGLGEAMALGKPVIATRYSGNLEFMDDTTAMLVPSERVIVGPGAEPYEATDHWAEPDLEVASQLMRRVVEDPEGARRLGRAARDEVLSHHGVSQAERFVARRLGEIEKLMRKGYVSGSAEAVRKML
jgi:glycosyltransferase involved in cell wall biosynthesis